MLNGYIKDDQPIIPILVTWKWRVRPIVALVDTGFTGELKITPETAQALGLVATHVRKVSFGDSRTAILSSALAFVSMEGIRKSVTVLIGEGHEVIGVRLLRNFGYSLLMDFEADSFILQKFPREYVAELEG